MFLWAPVFHRDKKMINASDAIVVFPIYLYFLRPITLVFLIFLLRSGKMNGHVKMRHIIEIVIINFVATIGIFALEATGFGSLGFIRWYIRPHIFVFVIFAIIRWSLILINARRAAYDT